MDNDNFTPAFVTAARVVGLGRYAINFLEVAGISLHEEAESFQNSISWLGENEIRERIKGILLFRRIEPAHTSVWTSLLSLAATYRGIEKELPAKLEIKSTYASTPSVIPEHGPVYNQELSEIETKVVAVANKVARTLINALGQSHFPQLPSEQKTVLHWGVISAAGAKIVGSSGWSVFKTAGNVYEISFAEAFPNGVPTVSGSDAQGTLRNFCYSAPNGSQINVVLQFGSSSVDEAITFSFMAIG